MRYLLDIIGIACLLAAASACTTAKSAIHEIAGLVLLLTGAVFIVGGVLLGAIHEATQAIKNNAEV